jgi:acyl dehydratase
VTRYYDDVQEGDQLPPLTRAMSVARMMIYGASTWDFIRLHYDESFAKAKGFLAPFVDGQMTGGHLALLVQNWAGPGGFIWKLSFRNRTMCFPGDVLTLQGAVTKKWIEKGDHLVECNLWVDNQKGEKVIQPGSAVVRLPVRRK